jgi:hypothetical protein
VSDDEASKAVDEGRAARIADGILVVREGHGANCSSIGSVIDTLFATAVVGGAVLAAVAAALAREKVRVVGGAGSRDVPGKDDAAPAAEEPPR